MSRRIAKAPVLASLWLATAGRGYSTGDRAASGGLIGGGIGAVGGAVTSGNDVNLRRPVWC